MFRDLCELFRRPEGICGWPTRIINWLTTMQTDVLPCPLRHGRIMTAAERISFVFLALGTVSCELCALRLIPQPTTLYPSLSTGVGHKSPALTHSKLKYWDILTLLYCPEKRGFRCGSSTRHARAVESASSSG
jgi:hypothetical protein